MECVKCKRTMSNEPNCESTDTETNSFTALDAAGTENRRWLCDVCDKEVVRLFGINTSKIIQYKSTGLTPQEIKTLLQKQKDGLVVELPKIPKDINDPLDPVKIHAALNSELMKFEFRKEHKPNDVSVLDYTIIIALSEMLKQSIEKNGEQL